MCDSAAPSEQVQQRKDEEVAVPVLHEHSNENLLKIDTNDRHATVAALKKVIAKELPEVTENGGAQPLLKGLLRMNKNPRNPCVFMAFATDEDRAAAARVLQTIVTRSVAWHEVPVTERDLNLTYKGAGKKRPRTDGEECGSKLTQYGHLPLEQQLERKKQHCLRVMKSILPAKVYGWKASSERFLGIVESPMLEGYRNHVNLSFGKDAAGEAALGFLQGSLVEGVSTIESAVDPDRNVKTMSPIAKAAATVMMNLCRAFLDPAKGGLQVFDKVTGVGFWRKLQVRHNVKGQVLIDVEVDEDSVPPAVFADVRQSITDAYSGDALRQQLREISGHAEAGVVSVQYHKHGGTTSVPVDAPRVVLWGEATLTEYLSGLQYELSPTAFFQVNTGGMERMLGKVHTVADLSPTTTLLDLCSGTGTIGLTLARYVKRVVGIELIPSAVDNAKRNAERNGVSNAVFHCGRVEHLLPTVINALPAEDRKDIVAILDPPRAGVTAAVLKWIRGTPTIRRVVYISCEQKALERDCPSLTKPATKAYRCTPFEVTAGFAVDLFPHTHHVEMVAVLTRREEEEKEAGGEARSEPATATGEAEKEEEDDHGEAEDGEASVSGDDDSAN